jgi:hypothetical protein
MSGRSRTLTSFLSVWLLVVALPAAGCRHSDLVEAELRTRDEEVRRLRGDLARAEADNHALSQELGALRPEGGSRFPPELAAQVYTLKRITLGHLTGGYADDHAGGDRALRVIVEPRDSDNHTIKAPGSVHVEALEISSEGLKTPLSAWDIDPIQVRRAWQGGLFTTGYVFILPWKKWPASDKLRIVAQFHLSDGRAFEADRDVTVRLPGKGMPKIQPAPAPLEGPILPPQPFEEPLPLPRKETSAGWQRTADYSTLRASWQKPVQPAPVWVPSEPPDLTHAVRVLKPVRQTSEEWPPRE